LGLKSAGTIDASKRFIGTFILIAQEEKIIQIDRAINWVEKFLIDIIEICFKVFSERMRCFLPKGFYIIIRLVYDEKKALLDASN
jgi:hypothetical protein